MADYVPHTWIEGDDITATRLNNIEGGVDTAHDEVHAAQADADAAQAAADAAAADAAQVQTNLNTHKDSADHDERYYTETEADARFAPVAWMVPSSTILEESLSEREVTSDEYDILRWFAVVHPGKYRVTGEARISDAASIDVRIGLLGRRDIFELGIGADEFWDIAGRFTTSLTTYQAWTHDFPSNIYIPAGGILLVMTRVNGGGSGFVRNLRLRGTLTAINPGISQGG